MQKAVQDEKWLKKVESDIEVLKEVITKVSYLKVNDEFSIKMSNFENCGGFVYKFGINVKVNCFCKSKQGSFKVLGKIMYILIDLI